MSVIFVLICASIFVAAIFLGAFLWAVKSGQYEDTYAPSVRILFEDQSKPEASDSETKSETSFSKK